MNDNKGEFGLLKEDVYTLHNMNILLYKRNQNRGLLPLYSPKKVLLPNVVLRFNT